jgi:hypothetical protein
MMDLNKYKYNYKIYSMIFIMIRINLVCGNLGVLLVGINYHLIDLKILLLIIQAQI